MNSLVSFIILSLFTSLHAFAGKTLIIGDSLSCGPFGKYLVQNIAKTGEEVTLYCTVSSAPSHWVHSANPFGHKCLTMTSAKPTLVFCNGSGKIPPLESLLSSFKKDRVIIALGTNSLISEKADLTYRTLMKSIKKNDSSCLWIAPPHMNATQSKGFAMGRVAKIEKNLNNFYDSLAESVESHCTIIESREATAPKTPGNDTVDGIHRSENAGKYWADAIIQQLTTQKNIIPSQMGAK